MPDCHTLIISDIHLGSRVCRAEKVLLLLRQAKFKILVINGDLFDGNDTYKLNAKHWDILTMIADIAKKQPVFLVRGNHGRSLDKFIGKLGVEVKDDYSFSIGEDKLLCLHGDEFDMYVKHIPVSSSIGTYLYYLLQAVGGEKQRIPMLIKRASKHLLRIQTRQQKLAMKHAADNGASVIICSHTHLPHEDMQDGIRFINSGSFCDNPCSYVTVSRNGQAELCRV
jgi:UDP-2,3-diacylglucosamine pyrophosphatase LpxH